uniref:Uncharacterized protein n=1 Tax=Chlamydomonas euryale TaxID=1486919 RepID=A0A7R9YRZ8_9CHLO
MADAHLAKFAKATTSLLKKFQVVMRLGSMKVDKKRLSIRVLVRLCIEFLRKQMCFQICFKKHIQGTLITWTIPSIVKAIVQITVQHSMHKLLRTMDKKMSKS